VFESPDPIKPSTSALTCLTEVELAMIGGRMARAFLVDDAPWLDDLIVAIDDASSPPARPVA
jgi:hypothetical protein